MQVFLAVVEARSFTAAAGKLGRTKSAISQSVTRLEADLGTQLLYRTTRSLSLTEAGGRFLAHCSDIRQSYDQALTDIQSDNGTPFGSLSVTAPHALCGTVIAPAIAALLKLHPEVDARLIADDAHTDLVKSQLDLAIRVGTPELGSAMTGKLGMMQERLYAAPVYVAAQGGIPPNLSDLAKWDHIVSDWQGIPVQYDLGGGTTIRAVPRARCNAIHDVLNLALEGIGVARLPNLTAAPYVQQKQLLPLASVGELPVYYLHLFPQNLPAKVRTFIGLLKGQLRKNTLLNQ